jgi:hypothetical protein
MLGAVEFHSAEGNGNMATWFIPCDATRSICGSMMSQRNLPFSGSACCHLSDQSRVQLTPALFARSRR